MLMPSPLTIVLSREERIMLENRVRQYTSSYCDVIRAKIVLLAADNAMFDDRGLPRVLKEQPAIVGSGLNVSTYCLPAHLEILGRLGLDKALGRKLALNYPSAPVEPKVMELFRFADKLTRSPGEMEKADVDRLREAGWSEAAISTRCSSRRCTRAPTVSPQASASSQTSRWPSFEAVFSRS
jgi:uncharacterized peroxidase-related enzyme